jgi:hypothetical protein
MKRTQLIEWGLITVALIFGYKFFEYTISFLVQVLYAFGEIDLGKLALRFLLICGAYATGFFILIRKSSQLASWINGPVENDSINIKINKQSLLQVILIGVCSATILANIAEIISYLFEIFKQEVGRSHDPIDNKDSNHLFKLAAIRTIIAFVVLYFSKDISNSFLRKNEADKLTFESETEKDT